MHTHIYICVHTNIPEAVFYLLEARRSLAFGLLGGYSMRLLRRRWL